MELIGKTDLSQQSIMVIGAGEMAESCVRLLVKKGAQSIFISNRSFDRALDLATRCGGEAVCFGYCLFEMRDVDVVIAATSSAETLLSCEDIENLMKARRNRPLLLIDLSVPRNIDPAVTGLDHVSLFNIDDLEAAGSPGRSGSRARVDRVPSNYRGARRGVDRETRYGNRTASRDRRNAVAVRFSKHDCRSAFASELEGMSRDHPSLESAIALGICRGQCQERFSTNF